MIFIALAYSVYNKNKPSSFVVSQLFELPLCPNLPRLGRTMNSLQ